MSLSLEDIKGEFREGYLRTEEVLSGMDAYIAKLENRISVLEDRLKRIAVLEDQMAAITAAIYEDEPAQPPKIFIG
jgi:hypothetical protein